MGIGEVKVEVAVLVSLTGTFPRSVREFLHALHAELPAAAVAVLHRYHGVALKERREVEVATKVGKDNLERGNLCTIREDTIVLNHICAYDGVLARVLYRREDFIIAVAAVKIFRSLADAEVWIVLAQDERVGLLLREVGGIAVPLCLACQTAVVLVGNSTAAVANHPVIEALVREAGQHQHVHRHIVRKVRGRIALILRRPLVAVYVPTEVQTRGNTEPILPCRTRDAESDAPVGIAIHVHRSPRRIAFHTHLCGGLPAFTNARAHTEHTFFLTHSVRQ